MIIAHWKLIWIENRKWKRILIKGSFFVNKLYEIHIYYISFDDKFQLSVLIIKQLPYLSEVFWFGRYLWGFLWYSMHPLAEL